MKKSNRITLDLPPEFIALCKGDGVEPRTVLRGFIADLCSIVNYADAPVRTDGYGSNGSDERLMAMEYYVRVGYPWVAHRPRPVRCRTPARCTTLAPQDNGRTQEQRGFVCGASRGLALHRTRRACFLAVPRQGFASLRYAASRP